ncbi:MAG: HlyD family type I secretion periplasmic adaptor subunit [Pseudomonadota bacterium]
MTAAGNGGDDKAGPGGKAGAGEGAGQKGKGQRVEARVTSQTSHPAPTGEVKMPAAQQMRVATAKVDASVAKPGTPGGAAPKAAAAGPSAIAAGGPAAALQAALAGGGGGGAPSGAAQVAQQWAPRRHLMIGMIALVVLVVGIGGWSVFSSIAGAVVATGQIEVESNRQVVQHPDGGVVGEILVDDGDLVDAGAVLLRFDDTLLRSELAIIESQYFEVVARRGRLVAEREGIDEITFDEVLLERESEEIADLMAGQNRLFESRRETRAQEISQLRERQTQISQQIGGLEAQLAALDTQQSLIGEELSSQLDLLERGLTQQSRVLALQREEARLLGQLGELTAGIAENRGRIAEIEIQIVNLVAQRREEAITTLRDLQFRENELRERRLSLLEQLSRMELRAPVSGVVYGRQVFAVRSVVRAADPVMYIVPQDSNLVISSRIEAIHVDQVHVGQEAVLRFSAFDQRTTPEVYGSVSMVSADVFTDEATGASFYMAEILPQEGEMEKLGAQTLIPGMPVETYIQTGARTPLNYLVKPLADYFNKAFREN